MPETKKKLKVYKYKEKHQKSANNNMEQLKRQIKTRYVTPVGTNKTKKKKCNLCYMYITNFVPNIINHHCQIISAN